MDAQLKRGILEFCVLAELCRGDSYGYKIEKDLASHVKLSESALYHILKRHEAAGFVRAQSVEHNGRLRRVYAITQDGRARLMAFKDEWQNVARAMDFIEKAVGGCDKE
ncbi:MAG: PadR family transcriptional regulator [Christensenellales bacterium]|jgi:PadR family transcriptional regulator PadR